MHVRLMPKVCVLVGTQDLYLNDLLPDRRSNGNSTRLVAKLFRPGMLKAAFGLGVIVLFAACGGGGGGGGGGDDGGDDAPGLNVVTIHRS